MDKTPSRKDSASAFQDRTPLRKDFASEFQLDKETDSSDDDCSDSSDDDCYNESMDTQDYDNVGCEAFQLRSEDREFPDKQLQLDNALQLDTTRRLPLTLSVIPGSILELAGLSTRRATRLSIHCKCKCTHALVGVKTCQSTGGQNAKNY